LFTFTQSWGKNYIPKHAKEFKPSELFQFWAEAPNEGEMLRTKAIALVGYYGCARTCELVGLTWKVIRDEPSKGAWVMLTRGKTPADAAHQGILIPRITGHRIVPADLFLEYKKSVFAASGRPVERVWRRWQRDHWTAQWIGKEKLKEAPKVVAIFLHLDPTLYRGHSWRPSGASALAANGGTSAQLKTAGGWHSAAVADSYIHDGPASRVVIAAVLSGEGSQESTQPQPRTAAPQPGEPPTKIPKIIFNGPVTNCTFIVN